MLLGSGLFSHRQRQIIFARSQILGHEADAFKCRTLIFCRERKRFAVRKIIIAFGQQRSLLVVRLVPPIEQRTVDPCVEG